MSDPISRWWAAFAETAPRIGRLFSHQEEWDLPEWMHEHLGAIHPDLMWEFGPAVEGDGHRLVITPEGRCELRPLVREILERAPRLDGWEFYEYRLPESLEEAALTVEGRVGGDIQGLQVHVCPGEFNCVDLIFHGFSDSDDDDRRLALAYVAAETLLGEETLSRWVGVIDTSSQSNEHGEPIGLERLRAEVDKAIESIKATRPNRPWHEVEIVDDTVWSLLEVKSEEADEYPEQQDLMIAVTLFPIIVENVAARARFDSMRYSRFGETFCYLKIDHGGKQTASLVDVRKEIEDIVNTALRDRRLGALIGGGTGRRYSYVELALCEIDATWEQIRLVLQDRHLPTRTWLLFHDDDLRAEWRGLYDDTPAPPMAMNESGEDLGGGPS